MNIYKYRFQAKCPNGDITDSYNLVIESDKLIQVESILTECDGLEAYQEDIADRLYRVFEPRLLILRGNHFGVKVTTVRP